MDTKSIEEQLLGIKKQIEARNYDIASLMDEINEKVDQLNCLYVKYKEFLRENGY